MIRRKRRMRYARRRYRPWILNAVLVAWAGALIVAFLNRPADTGPNTHAEAFGEDARQVADSQPSEPSLTRADGDDRNGKSPSAAVAGSGDPQTQSSTTASSQEKLTGDPKESPAGSAAVSSGSQAETGLPADAADLARLEAAPEPVIDTTPGAVARSQFTTGIRGREPVNRVEAVFSIDGQVFSLNGKALPTLYYFTEITGMVGETVSHRWEFDGVTVAETSFDIGGDRWRLYSKKALPPNAAGTWRVVVTDGQGNVMKTDSFTYQEP